MCDDGKGAEHHRQRLLAGDEAGPGQARAGIDDAEHMNLLRWRVQEDVARQAVQVRVPEFSDGGLDNASLLLDGFGAAVDAVAHHGPVDR